MLSKGCLSETDLLTFALAAQGNITVLGANTALPLFTRRRLRDSHILRCDKGKNHGRRSFQQLHERSG